MLDGNEMTVEAISAELEPRPVEVKSAPAPLTKEEFKKGALATQKEIAAKQEAEKKSEKQMAEEISRMSENIVKKEEEKKDSYEGAALTKSPQMDNPTSPSKPGAMQKAPVENKGKRQIPVPEQRTCNCSIF